MFAPRSIFSRPASLLRPLMQRRGLARLTVTGHLGDIPEVLPLASGGEVIKFSVAAISNSKTSPKKANWFRISCIPNEGSRLRELLVNLQKGTLVHVEADAVHSSWEDQQGVVKHTLNFYQRQIEILKRPANALGEVEEAEEVGEKQ
ncbi:MAG: Mitochondrial Translation Optimization [Trizodia sp. TS-e1964]|nr:MAG: Mitochondrial Translation Optimization [Trizodia sp. TS-e1964]